MSTLDDDNAIARQKLQAKKTQIALNSSEAFQRIVPLVTKPLRKDQTMSMRQNMREIISRTMRPPAPVSTRFLPALQLKSMKHRALACRWHLGLFPVHYRYLSNIVTWLGLRTSLARLDDAPGEISDSFVLTDCDRYTSGSRPKTRNYIKLCEFSPYRKKCTTICWYSEVKRLTMIIFAAISCWKVVVK